MDITLTVLTLVTAAPILTGASWHDYLLFSGVLGSLVADVIWFYIGIFKGRRALNLLCRISLNPDSCVRRT